MIPKCLRKCFCRYYAKVVRGTSEKSLGKDGKMKQPQNPLKAANFFSLITFGYTFSTFIKGFKKEFEEEDISETLEEHSSRILGDILETAWLKEIRLYKNPSLVRATFRAFGNEIITRGFVELLKEIFRILQPLALSSLVAEHMKTNGAIDRNKLYMYCGWLIGSAFITNLIDQLQTKSVLLLGMKLKIACCSLVYKKSLKLSKSALGGIPTGQLTNLLSNDVNRLDSTILHIHALWLCPVEVVVVLAILYELTGAISTVGIVLMALLIPIYVYCGKKASKYRLDIANNTDKRMRLMNEIISGIQVIKMYTWEKSFAKLIEEIRRFELGGIRVTSYMQAFLMSTVFTPKIAIFISLLTYTLTGNVPQADYIFTVTVFYNFLRDIVTLRFPRSIIYSAGTCVTLKRLENYLAYDQVQDNNKHYQQFPNDNNTEAAIVKLENVSAKWSSKLSENSLHNITFSAKKNEIVAIIGPVGSGKTSILHVILNELIIEQGNVHLSGKISYASQEPWIINGNIQENILLGRSINFERYRNVIKICCLECDLDLLPYGEYTLVGEKGITLSGGQKARINLARALYEDADIYLLDDPLSSVDSVVGKQLFEKGIKQFLHDKCTVLVSHQMQYLHDVDKVLLVEEGTISATGTFQELKQSGLKFASYLQNGNNVHAVTDAMNVMETCLKKVENRCTPPTVKEQRSRGSISKRVYNLYFNACKSKSWVILVCMTFVLTQGSASALDYFTSLWAVLEQDANFGILQSREICLYIYSGLCILLITLAILRSVLFFKHCLKASAKLHQNMLEAIINSTMSFYGKNTSGMILNRFSNDMGVVDETIPKAAISCFQSGLIVISSMLVITIVNPWMLLPMGVVLLVFYLLRMIYLPTSTSMKRITAITRSPIYTQINESLRGLTTIRAFQIQQLSESNFHKLQDLNTSACSLRVSCTTAFCYYTELTCILYIACVTITILVGQSEHYGGNIGLVISQAISIGGILQLFMREWTELDCCMTSAERIIDYSNIQQEPLMITNYTAQNWPQKGEIKYSDVSLKYGASKFYTLRDINFHIQPHQKIGIVGRTGAGKSSLLLSLFQLSPTEGTISIDGVDITTIPLSNLRSKIAIIPQQPILFSETIRNNLDPFGQSTDDELWTALDDVELKSFVANLPLGLSYTIHEGGSNFSVGQRQLICLARAIVSKTKILVLDEATANVDPHSDHLIQDAIKKKFVSSTVLVVAHRLNTVIDCDKIIVLDAGKVSEFDHPYRLLQNQDGLFYSMVQQLGNDMFRTLYKTAEITSCR